LQQTYTTSKDVETSKDRSPSRLGRSRPEMNVRGGLRNLCKDCGVHFV